MFGSGGGGSPTKESPISTDSLPSPTNAAASSKTQLPPSTEGSADSTAAPANNDRNVTRSESPSSKQRTEQSPSGRKKTGSKARDIFSSAKSSLSSFSGSPSRSSMDRGPQSPIQKLGKTDAALSVPQGSQNNAAGESHPGPRSTFRVGVTEDKNKKCRRTMEDTHAYLYNFLSTPAPAIGATSSSENVSRVRSSSSNNSLEAIKSVSAHPVVESDNGYFAIFDGHAGTFAAEWCGKKLHLLLEDMIRKNPNKPIPELLDATFTDVDQQLEKLPLKNSGCTAVTAVLRWEDRIPNSQSATGSTSIAPAAAALAAAKPHANSDQPQLPDGDHTMADGVENPGVDQRLQQLSSSATRSRVLYTANVGDARIVLCRNGKALRLSYDHKGSDDNEGKRVANAGGLILNNRVNGVLAVTRALGDAYMKDLVTGHPYTTETVIQPELDEFLILACDGLWDVCSDQEAVDLIRNVEDPQTASRLLVEHALNRFSTDNLSCMVVRFDRSALQDNVEHRVEPIGVEGDPGTKVRGGITEAQAIISEARKTLGVDIPVETDLDRIPSEISEEAEPGPELDPTGLEKAKEKALEGKREAGLVPGGPSATS